MFRDKLRRMALGIARKVGDPRYLAYELPIIEDIVLGVETVLKMPRQTGKTWSVACVACAYLLMGRNILVAYPTLIQGQRLLLSEIALILRKLGIGLVKFNSLGIELSAGPRVFVVTTHESAISVEGYTVGLLVVDESHKAESYKLSEMIPALKIAYEKGEATAVLCGIKGARLSMIEVAWRERGFNLIHIKPDEILEKYPGYQIALDVYRRMLTDDEYATQILCKGAPSNRAIFHNVHEPLPDLWVGQPHEFALGVDIGQVQDATVVTLLKIYPSNETPHVEVIETVRYKDKYPIQGQKIIDFVRLRGLQKSPLGFELNGIGRGLYDIVGHIERNETDPIENVCGLSVNKRSKRNIIQWLQWLDREHCLHVKDEAMLNALDGLEEVRDDEGKMKYDHSDYLSSLVVAGAMVSFG